MKKIISIVILCAMLLATLASCGAPTEQALNLENYPAANENTAPVGFTGNKTVSTTEGEYDVWDRTTKDTAWWDNKAEGTTTFTLTTAEEFMGFLELRKNKEAFDGITIQLGIDIILNEVKDGKAGNVQSKSDLKTTVSAPVIPGNAGYFTGTFDGQNHVISGWYMTNNGSNRSVFGAFGGGTLKNVAVVDSVWYATERSSKTSVFGLISVINDGSNSIQNVYSNVAITTNYVTATTYANEYTSVGGFVGNVNGAAATLNINNCESVCSMTEVNGQQVGGFIGQINAAEAVVIRNSVNRTNINSDQNSVGGFVGFVNKITENFVMDNCVNYGTITADRLSGGLVGNFNNVANGYICFKDCVNEGDVNATVTRKHKTHQAVGGLVGKIYAGENVVFEGCRQLADVNVVLKQNTNASVNLHYNTYIGGILGQQYLAAGASGKSITVKDCYVKGQINVTENTSTANAYFTGAYVGGILNEYMDAHFTGNINKTNVSAACGSLDKTWVGIVTHVADLADGADMSGDGVVKKNVVPVGTDAAAAAFILGVQEKANDNNTTDLRYVAAINLAETSTAAGFKVAFAKNNAEGTDYAYVEKSSYVTNVYKTVKGTVGDKTVTYSAADYGMDYLMTLVIPAVPNEYLKDAKSFKMFITPFEQTNADSEPAMGQTAIDGETTYLYANRAKQYLWTGANMSATQYDFTGKSVVTIPGGSYDRALANGGVSALAVSSVYHYYLEVGRNLNWISHEDTAIVYTFDVEEAGEYTLYLNLRLKLDVDGNTGNRYISMLVDEMGYDMTNAYYMGYDSFSGLNAEGTSLYQDDTDGTYVATGITLNLTAGKHTLVFKSLGDPTTLHFRNLYLVK